MGFPEETLFFLHQHTGTAMAMKELELAPMPLNTVGNKRTQTCIDAAQAAQHCKAHVLIFFINCRLSLLIAGMNSNLHQYSSSGSTL
jgi:hypothetical protein